MRQLLPGRYNLSDATFSRASMAYDDVGRLAGLAVPRIAKTPYGKMAMVEEGTANLVPVDKQKFEGWTAYSGAVVTLTQNQSVPEWGCTDATRIQVSGGTNTYKYLLGLGFTSVSGQSYTNSIHIKNIGSAPVRIGANFPYTATVAPGETKKVILINIGDGVAIYRFDFYSVNASDSLDFIAWHPMAETKPYPTSFIETSRAAESLTMPVLATNLLTPNLASVESRTTGFTANTGAETITRDTTEYKYGSASLKVVTPGNVINEGFYISQISASASLAYTISLWAKGTGTIKLILYEYTSTGSAVGATTVTVTLSDIWTRYSVTRSLGSTGALVRLLVQTLTVQAITFYADGLQLELGPYATTWNLPTEATTPRIGLPVEHGTIEGIVEINDLSKRQDGTTNYFCNLSGGVFSNAIAFMHLGTSAYYRLSVWDDTGIQSYASFSDSLISNGFYYYKIHWSGVAVIELWDLLTQNKVASGTISDLDLPSAFGSHIYLGSRNRSAYHPNTHFGKHRLSNIARTDDPDFNNLMPVDANTVAIFDPTYSFLS
jgi:hypothetical protein